MALLDDVKISLRISSNAYDTEITDLINACKSDLLMSGIYVTDDTDSLIKRAINLYVKSNFGYDNPDADRLSKSYDMLKTHLMLSIDYSFYTVTFTITDSSDSEAIRESHIKLWNDELNYEKTLSTDENGQAVFYVFTKSNYKYNITAKDYVSDLHEEDDKNIVDVTDATNVAVALSPS